MIANFEQNSNLLQSRLNELEENVLKAISKKENEEIIRLRNQLETRDKEIQELTKILNFKIENLLIN